MQTVVLTFVVKIDFTLTVFIVILKLAEVLFELASLNSLDFFLRHVHFSFLEELFDRNHPEKI